ncbi:hypothetical protein GCM10008995_22390 [Halobellus salinus]|uniref:Uncharacterized protein n=1 Tax=Halobellus salinus TaxID=931585 RepID=A0A830EHX5_9EURY|nr:hypothetical protein [Halobellus salinus]GGJ12051.1 hypothetical protein GCM10008995_22390 [Halobellus salinus]SMP02858.1 hypothetical protein SAMN06265347_101235 [Halobellus salinus]
MRRRRVLSGAAAIAAAAVTGCTGGEGGTATDGGEPTDATGTATPTTTPDGLAAVTFTPREPCPDPGGATVRLGADPVSVVGCVVGTNGCTRPQLASVDRDAGAVTVVVAAVEEREDGEACAEALVDLGYEVRIDYADPPTSVTVVHDDTDGRRTVVDATR